MASTTPHTTPHEAPHVDAVSKILRAIGDLAERIDVLDARIAEIACSQGKRRSAPEWLTVAEAARLAGLTKRALDGRLRRLAERPGGSPIRRRHGLVHRGEFLSWLRDGSRGRGRTAADAVDHLEI